MENVQLQAAPDPDQAIQPAGMNAPVECARPTMLLRFFGRLLDCSERLNIKHSIFGNPPVYSPDLFPWARRLEEHWQEIRAELDAVLERREELPNFQDISADAGAIQADSNWKTFFLCSYGHKAKENCRRCPRTAKLLQEIPEMKTAFFSILSPGKRIPAHRGPYNGVLRYHLGLLVPRPAEKCRIRIHDRIYHWGEGESLIFDDAYNHEVWNETSGLRAVLFIDFLRPLLFPAAPVRDAVIAMASRTPFIKGAQDRHEKWEKKFYECESGSFKAVRQGEPLNRPRRRAQCEGGRSPERVPVVKGYPGI